MIQDAINRYEKRIKEHEQEIISLRDRITKLKQCKSYILNGSQERLVFDT